MQHQWDPSRTASGAAEKPDEHTRRDVLAGVAATSLVGWPLTGIGAEPGDLHLARAIPRDSGLYETTRRKCVWNTATPDRFPDLIVQPTSTAEVVDVIRYAKARGMSVAVRGSGHNYTSTYLRDGGVLLDVSALKQVRIDKTRAVVSVQPGITNAELAAFLTAHGRAFPTGHHGGVGLGGYLLGGGMGWNGESWGQFACFNVKALDVVTANGTSLRASEHSHPDLYWAARGAGPLFCAVATEFQLRTFPAPPVILSSRYTYDLGSAGQVARWLQKVADELNPDLDLFSLFITDVPSSSARASTPRKIVLVYVLSYAERASAEAVLRRIGRAAPLGEVTAREELVPVTFADLYADSLTGPARRTGADTAWTNESIRSTEVLAELFESVPSTATVGIINYRTPPRLPEDAACSVSGAGFLQWLGQWDDPSRDHVNLEWAQEAARKLEPYAVGAYVNESDIFRRPARLRRCFTPAAFARLQAVRATYDPGGLLPPPIPI